MRPAWTISRQLLVPFLAVVVVIGGAGGFVILRDLSERAIKDHEQDLTRRLLGAQLEMVDDEFYLVESVRFAANIEGLAAAVTSGNVGVASERLASVAALKTRLSLVAVTDERGRGLVELAPGEPEDRMTAGGDWSTAPPVRAALAGDGRPDDVTIGIVSVDGRTSAAAAARIGAGRGAVLCTLPIDAGTARRMAQRSGLAIALFDASGARLGSSEAFPEDVRPTPSRRATVRTVGGRAGERSVITAPLTLKGETVGAVVGVADASAAAAQTRRAGTRLLAILLATAMATLLIGSVVMRRVTTRIDRLVHTSRRLAAGDMTARSQLAAGDELAELSLRFDEMADALQDTYRELEQRVQERTRELADANEQLGRAMRARSDLFAAVSHDLRTPLVAIRLQAEALAMHPDLTKPASILVDSARHLSRLVDEILDLAKDESGHLDLETDDVAPADVIRSVQPTVRALAEGARLHASIEVAPDMPRVTADPRRLCDVLFNLASNAVKYTPPGGRVGIEAESDGDVVRIAVWDTGPGIPPADRERIFEPFVRLPGTPGVVSTGLGLAWAKRIVEAHGGTLLCLERDGGGCVFEMRLKAAVVPASTRRAPARRRA